MVLGFNHTANDTTPHVIYVEYDYDISHQVDAKTKSIYISSNTINIYQQIFKSYQHVPTYYK